MKQILIVAIILSVILFSCKTKKSIYSPDISKSDPIEKTTNVAQEEVQIAPEPGYETPIVVKTEDVSLAEDEDQSKGDFAFYVIIGSFSNPTNAGKFKKELAEKGFKPLLLNSETGFVRVSVDQTNSEKDARNVVLKIRNDFPEHKDVWLLKKK